MMFRGGAFTPIPDVDLDVSRRGHSEGRIAFLLECRLFQPDLSPRPRNRFETFFRAAVRVARDEL